ncbi:hypothetical protein Tco_1376674 [Tanacetum coccineum]
MTRSLENELFTPFKDPEREFRLSRKHFKTLWIDELRSPDFNFFSDQEYSEEEVAETMTETMEQYMSKTRADYGSGVARPKIEQEPDENLYQAWERFKELLMKCPQHYLTEMQEVILFYNGLRIPTRHILDSRGGIPSKIAADAKNNTNPSYQERRQSMEDTLRKFMSESAKIHEENSNLIKEIRASIDAAIQNQGALIKTLEIQIGQMSKVLEKRGFGRLPSSTKANPRDQVMSISTTIEAD